jgi:hypothetical protein
VTEQADDVVLHSDPFLVVFWQYPKRVIAGMICFSAFFGIAVGLGSWLPNIPVERGFTIAKSLNSIFWITLAFLCASAFMMFALECLGRKPTAVVAFNPVRPVRAVVGQCPRTPSGCQSATP